MKDVILWTAVFGPFVLGLIVLGFALWEAKRTSAEVHGRYAAIDDELTYREDADRSWRRVERMRAAEAFARYDSGHGKTLPSSTSPKWERPRVLRPSSAPDQSGDSRRRGDC
jgi:hypothetical protein